MRRPAAHECLGHPVRVLARRNAAHECLGHLVRVLARRDGVRSYSRFPFACLHGGTPCLLRSCTAGGRSFLHGGTPCLLLVCKLTKFFCNSRTFDEEFLAKNAKNAKNNGLRFGWVCGLSSKWGTFIVFTPLDIIFDKRFAILEF